MRQVRSFLKLLIPLSIIMFVMQAIFVRSGTPVFLSITNEGLMLGLMVCLRLLCLALPLIPALVTTKLTDLANACVEVLHVPYQYAFTFTTALRFVPVFSQEMNAIMEAQTARASWRTTRPTLSRSFASCCRSAFRCSYRAWARRISQRSRQSSAAST